MQAFDLIVIGAGITGVAVAARAVEAGLRVAVVEQHATVAQGASFAHNGLVWPSPLDGWFGPGPRHPDPRGGLPWRRRSRLASADAAKIAAFAALDALSDLGRENLRDVENRHGLDYESRTGALYLFRSNDALARARTVCAEWPQARHPPAARMLDVGACRTTEPALLHTEGLRGAVALDDLVSGNCALAAKRLKTRLGDPFEQRPGVTFYLARRAVAIHTTQKTAVPTGNTGSGAVSVDIIPANTASGAFSGVQAKGFVLPTAGAPTSHRDQAQRITGRHLVLACGSGTGALLASIGLGLPVMRVENRSLTGAIARPEHAPRRMLIDAERGVGMVRFEHRLRVSAAFGTTATVGAGARAKAPFTTLIKQADGLGPVLHDCAEHHIPGAARLNAAVLVGEHLCGADGLPVIGRLSAAPTVSLALAASHLGWGLAFGVARYLVDGLHATADATDERIAALAALSPGRFG